MQNVLKDDEVLIQGIAHVHLGIQRDGNLYVVEECNTDDLEEDKQVNKQVIEGEARAETFEEAVITMSLCGHCLVPRYETCKEGASED